jgi:hypothetical protein
MTVTLTLKPDVEAGLLAKAQAAGLTVERHLLLMVEAAVLPVATSTSPEQRAAALESWAAGHRATPLLSDYAISREAMYEGRDQ